jgi:CRP-like cAMP-binding protein
MLDPFINFNRFIKQRVEISDAELEVLNKSCDILSLPKGHIMIKAGEKQENLYFIVKGIVRNFIDTKEGESMIYNFRIENMQVTGYAPYNYADEIKALVSVQCLEECLFIKVPLVVIKYCIEHMKFGERLGRFMAEAHVLEMVKYVIDRDTLSILERYDNLERAFPNIHQRVPQHMIASYLGITPVHLSNVKKSRKNAGV